MRIGSIGLSKQEFFRAVNALVDGHTTPAAVTQEQREWTRRASLRAQLTPPTIASISRGVPSVGGWYCKTGCYSLVPPVWRL